MTTNDVRLFKKADNSVTPVVIHEIVSLLGINFRLCVKFSPVIKLSLKRIIHIFLRR